MPTIKARAPLRLGLAGGGTDVSPYCDQFGGNVLNATIDRYAYAVLKFNADEKVSFVASDMQQSETFPISANLPLNGSLNLHVAVYNHIIKNYNNNNPLQIELNTYCDAPVGSGLGSSSTLVVAMVKAFVELLNLPIDDYDIARIAFQIERVDCGFAGGRQDQFSATFGGFNFMEFSANDRSIVNPLRIKNWIINELEASIVLYFTGTSRTSAEIIENQSKNVKDNQLDALEAMHGMKMEALHMKECLLKGDFEKLVSSIKTGWENKKRSANSISNHEIDTIYSAALDAGALAGKVSGAGGGGFMWFFVPTEDRMNLIRTLQKFGGSVSNCHFTKNGTQAWTLK